MPEAGTDRSLQLVLEQGHGTPIWRAAMLTNHVCIPYFATGGGNVLAFVDDSHEHDKLRAEFELWKQRWHAAAEPPKTALDAYTACNASLFPNLSILLQVLVTLPVTTATPERSFSTLKRLKTYFRSSMRDERLTSLALIHVHAQTTPIEPVEVVDKLALTGPHKLNFLRYCHVFVMLFISLY